MPPVAAAVATFLASLTVFEIIMAVAIVASIGMMVYSLSNMPQGFDNEIHGRQQVVRSAVSPHRIIYGQVMVSGALVFSCGSGNIDNNKFLYLVIVLAGHQVEEIGDVYLGDTISTDDKFTIVGRWQDIGLYEGDIDLGGDLVRHPLVKITKYLGSDTQTADPELMQVAKDKDGNLIWTENHRLQGCAYLVVRLEWNVDVFPTGIPNIKALVKGNNQIYDPRTTLTGYSTNWALCVRDYLTKPYGLNCAASEIDDPTFIAAANISDEQVAVQTNANRVDAFEERYTCNGSFTLDQKPIEIMQRLLSAGAGKLVWQQGKYRIKAGAYSAATRAALTESDLRGKLVIQTQASKQSRFNGIKGKFCNARKYWQEGDFPLVKNDTYIAEDNSEEIFKDLTLSFTTSDAACQRIAKILLEKNRRGITVNFPGKLTVFDVSVGDTVPVSIARLGWVNKQFEVMDYQLSKDGGVDLVLKEESSACYNWSSSEETIVDAAADVVLPDPRVVIQPVNLSLTETLYSTNTKNVVMVQGEFSWDGSDATAKKYRVQLDGVTVGETELSTWNFYDTPLGSHTFSVAAINNLGVTSPYATLTQTIHGKQEFPNPPSSVTSALEGDYVRITIVPPADLDIASYQVRYGSTWDTGTDIGTIAFPSSSLTWLPDVAGELQFWVKTTDTSGLQSLPATTSTLLNVDMPNVTGLADYYLGSVALLRWNPVIDVRAFLYEIRLGEDFSRAIILGTTSEVSYPVLSNGTYWVTAKTAHVQSPTPASIAITGAVLTQNVVQTYDEFATGLTGTLSGAAEIDIAGRVWLKTVGGEVQSPGYYEIPVGHIVDVGSVQTCNLSANYTASADSPFALFDDVASVDALANWDGDYAGWSDVKIQISLSQDGSTWADWKDLIPGPHVMRAVKFRAKLTSSSTSVTAVLSAFEFTVDMPDRTERFSNLTLDAAGTAITYSSPFQIRPNEQVTILNPQAGDRLNIVALNNSGKNGFTPQILNNGVGVSRNVNILVQGY